MENNMRIYCKNNNTYKDFELGTRLLEMYETLSVKLPKPLAGARVNNISRPLTYRCYTPKDVEFIDLGDPSGMRSYVRSLCCILSKAVYDLFPAHKIYFEHPVSKGYYCDLNVKVITDEVVRAETYIL